MVKSNRPRKTMVKRKKTQHFSPFFLISLEIHNFIFPFVKFELKGKRKRKKKESLGGSNITVTNLSKLCSGPLIIL